MSKFLTAPLLAIIRGGDTTILAVGQTWVLHKAGYTEVKLLIRQMWLADRVEEQATRWRTKASFDGLAVTFEEWIGSLFLAIPSDITHAAVYFAKTLASRSRDAIQELRNLRYDAENTLSRHLRREPYAGSLELLLADIVELSSAAGRARDEARAAVREGLHMWRIDDAAYHAHRQLLDPTLAARPFARKATRRPWFALYDAAVRQCINLRVECGEEVDALKALLDAGSSIAVARDASAQETFNLLATVGAVAFGLPALVLALYSASTILPFDSFQRLDVLLPVLVAGILSAVVAVMLPGEMSKRGRLVCAGGFVITTLSVLILAGVLAPTRVS